MSDSYLENYDWSKEMDWAADKAAREANSSVNTSLGQISLGRGSPSSQSFSSIDKLIEGRTPAAIDIATQGAEESKRLAELATGAGIDPLRQFTGTQAFDEQQALLGARGAQAQEQAIGGMPIAAFDQKLMDRQQAQLKRRASASGDLGSGATLEGVQQLGGAQRMQMIQQRLAELEPLVALSRGTRSTISGMEEAGGARQAQLSSGRGTQLANIRLGATAPLIQSQQQQAELSGLKKISTANTQGQVAQSLAGLAGQFAPQISNLFTPQQPVGTQIQTSIPEPGYMSVA